jgi:hypothetical protein
MSKETVEATNESYQAMLPVNLKALIAHEFDSLEQKQKQADQLFKDLNAEATRERERTRRKADVLDQITHRVLSAHALINTKDLDLGPHETGQADLTADQTTQPPEEPLAAGGASSDEIQALVTAAVAAALKQAGIGS